MRYFDLHCDTVTELFKNKKTFKNNNMHIDFNKCDRLDKYVQLYAVFIPDELRGSAAVKYFNDVFDFFNALLLHTDNFESFAVNSKSKYNYILTVEGASACGGTIDGIIDLYNKGVKVITLTWNGDNEIASGCFSDNDKGFTPFGKEALLCMKTLGIIPDISHLGKKSFSELSSFYDGPFIATHSNFDMTENIYGKTRNLDDGQVKEILSRRGLIGVNFCEDFLGDNGNTGFEAVLRHLYKYLELGCADILSFGSDFDGCSINRELEGIDKISFLYDFLLKNGIDKKTLEKIFYINAYNFFTEHS